MADGNGAFLSFGRSNAAFFSAASPTGGVRRRRGKANTLKLGRMMLVHM